MDCQVPDDIHVFLIEAKVHPRHTDIAQSAQSAALNQLLHFHDRGAVDERVAGHQNSPGKVSDPGQLRCFVTAIRERLFDEHVFAPHESTFGQFVVGTDVRCDHYRVNVGFQKLVKIAEPFERWILPSDFAQLLWIEIATGGELTPFVVCKYAREVWAPIPQTYKTDSEHQHSSVLCTALPAGNESIFFSEPAGGPIPRPATEEPPES